MLIVFFKINHLQTNNFQNIRDSRIKIFSPHTNDESFILFNDLQTAYLLNLMMERLDFKLSNINIEYVFPSKSYVVDLLKNISNCDEEYFIFYLENYYHSSDFALEFTKLVLSVISKCEIKPKVIIYTLKAEEEDCRKIIENNDSVELVINCDIEYFFNELFYKKTPIKNIQNIIYREGSDIIHNEKTNITYDINEYIIGAYYSGYYNKFNKPRDYVLSLFDDSPQHKQKVLNHLKATCYTEAMLTTGRGCKYKCSYCYRGVKYSKVRQISLETIKKDLDYLENLGYEYIYIYDDCFITTNYDRMDDLINLLKDYSFSYGISTRYEVCSSTNLKKLSELNIKRIQIGLQSISIESNKETRRGFNKLLFEKTLKEMDDLGIKVSLDLILGLPGEGLKGFISTFNYAISLKPVSIFINSLFLNPGTELYRNKESYGIVTTEDKGGQSLFYVPSIHSSHSFTDKDIALARKYVNFYVNKIKNISITLR